MTAEREGLAEIARVLGEHLPRDRYDDQGHSLGTYCSGCGWTGDYFADGESGPFDLHLADALADLLAARDRRVRAEAVREAADEWPREVNTETIRRELATFDLRETPPEYRVDDWLRDRADRIEAEG